MTLDADPGRAVSVDLDVPDDAVWAYVLQLVVASAGAAPAVAVRCSARGCSRVLGRAGQTPAGPLFSATWPVEDTLPVVTVVGGRRLRPRGQIAHLATGVVAQSGPEPAPTRPEGFFAPLAVPACLPQVAVPLYVRCPRHGDAVLERDHVLAALRGGRQTVVAPTALPFMDYTTQRTDGLPHQTVTSTTTYRTTGDPLQLADVHEWLRQHDGSRWDSA